MIWTILKLLASLLLILVIIDSIYYVFIGLNKKIKYNKLLLKSKINLCEIICSSTETINKKYIVIPNNEFIYFNLFILYREKCESIKNEISCIDTELEYIFKDIKSKNYNIDRNIRLGLRCIIKKYEKVDVDLSLLYSYKSDVVEIENRLRDRSKLLDIAGTNRNDRTGLAAVVLQNTPPLTRSGVDTIAGYWSNTVAPAEVSKAVNYRLSVTDLFIEKAQYHLEERAIQYLLFGSSCYVLAIIIFIFGLCIAAYKLNFRSC